MTARRGLFIALEGGEGAGKTTLAAGLAARLRRVRSEVVVTREPGGTSFGERARELLALDGLTPWAEALLFLSARAQLVSEVIEPALATGKTVLCDRYAASTLAYQGHGRGVDLGALRLVNRLATAGLEPDLTVLLDLDPEVGLARKAGEHGGPRTGSEPLFFHRRVRDGFLRLAAEAAPGTWLKLDATAPAAAIEEAAWEAIRPRLPHEEAGIRDGGGRR